MCQQQVHYHLDFVVEVGCQLEEMVMVAAAVLVLEVEFAAVDEGLALAEAGWAVNS